MNAVLHQKLAMRFLELFTPMLEQFLEDGKGDSGFKIAYSHETAQMLGIMVEYLHESAVFSDDEESIKRNKLAITNMAERLLWIRPGGIDFNRN